MASYEKRPRAGGQRSVGTASSRLDGVPTVESPFRLSDPLAGSSLVGFVTSVAACLALAARLSQAALRRLAYAKFRQACIHLAGATLASLLAWHPALAMTAHTADPSDRTDAAILRAFGDDVGQGSIKDSCGTIVRPVISFPASSVSVVVEADPTGACSGASPPSTLGVLVRANGVWHLSTSTPGTSYREQRRTAGMPDIVVQYPPAQANCPVLSWNGSRYAVSRPCSPGSH